jgi:hypothetical protein
LDPLTHYRINLRIAQSPIQEFSLDDYLREQLDVQEGIRKVLKGEEWMWDGHPVKSLSGSRWGVFTRIVLRGEFHG